MKIFELYGSIFIENDKANKSLSKTENKVKKLAGGLGKGIKTAALWGGALAAAAGVAASAIGGVALKSAADFEKQMANVSTLLDGDENAVSAKLEKLGKNVKNLAKDTGTSTDLLTDGLYQTISAFGETEDAMKILETASKGAKAGNATVTDSVNLLSAVTKGYGDTSAEAAQKASDLAFLTVKLGQTTFPELASSMGKVIPLAGSLKVSQEELFGAMATLTGVTGGTAEVSTQLRATLQGLMKPTKSMTAALEEMGYENGAAALEAEGLQGILTKLKDSVDGDEVALANLFSSVEAGAAVLALTGAQADNFVDKTNAMKEAAGSTEAAFEKQTKTVSGMMEKLKSNIDVLAIKLGEKLLPAAITVLEWVMEHMPEIESFVSGAFEVIGQVINVTVDTFNNVLLPAFKAIYDWVFENWGTIQTIVNGVFDGIKLAWSNVLEPALTALWEAVKGIVAWISDNWGTISSVFETVFNAIQGFWNEVLSPVLGFFLETVQNVYNWVTENFSGIVAPFEVAFEAIRLSVETVIGAFKTVIDTIKAAYDALVSFNNLSDNTYNNNMSKVQASSGVHGKHATGLNRVPFDGYIAELHKGERVLTAREVKEMDSSAGRRDRTVDRNSSTVNVTINSPQPLKPYEIAKEFKRVSRELAYGLR